MTQIKLTLLESLGVRLSCWLSRRGFKRLAMRIEHGIINRLDDWTGLLYALDPVCLTIIRAE